MFALSRARVHSELCSKLKSLNESTLSHTSNNCVNDERVRGAATGTSGSGADGAVRCRRHASCT
jgi:hypothetical protein